MNTTIINEFNAFVEDVDAKKLNRELRSMFVNYLESLQGKESDTATLAEAMERLFNLLDAIEDGKGEN